MKNTLLTAALAAVALSGCDERPTPRPAPIARVAAVTPAAPVAQVGPDAGRFTQAEPVLPAPAPVETLAIAHDQKGVDHLKRARELKTDGDLTGALTEARKALFTAPRDEDTLQLVAQLARSSQQPKLSAEALGRLATLRPDDAALLIAQARELVKAQDFSQAAQMGREAVKKDAANPEAWQVLGRAHLAAADLPSAIIAFEKVVELSPTHGYALNNLGFAYLRANENQAALQVLTRAAEALPNVAYVHNNLGVALERTGYLDEAKAEYAQATSLSPKYVKSRINADRVAKAMVNPEMEEEATPEIPSDVHPTVMP